MDRQTEKQKGRLTDKQTNDKRLTRLQKLKFPTTTTKITRFKDDE